MTTPSTAFVVMAGGKGERLWPLVRDRVPKACISMDGRETLLETTLERIQPFTRRRDALIVTTKTQARPIQRLLPRALRHTLLIEPQPKNTAACIALAAAVVAWRDPTAVMVVLPADHWMKPASAFHQSLRAAIDVARTSGRLVTIGLRPTRIHPGLGYLCAGSSAGVRLGCRIVRLNRFLEKPSPRVAQRLIRHRRTYWNAGIFIGLVGTFLEAIHQWLPEHARRLVPLAEAVGRPTFARHADAAYRALPAVSFDQGVMTHMHDGYVVEGRFEWEDLGSWDSWVRMSRLAPSSLSIGGKNVSIVSTDGHLVATAGLDDVIIVHTPDATLVCRAEAAQAVRAVVDRLSRHPRFSRYR